MYPLDLEILLGTASKPYPTLLENRGPRPDFTDWRDHNSLSRTALETSIAAMPLIQQDGNTPCLPEMPFGADHAWQYCATALRNTFPALGEHIDLIANHAPKCLAPVAGKHPVPFTYDLGDGKMPFISLHYRARPADLLAMVHEFGHGVQILASACPKGTQMPPVARECCAFLAEEALVLHAHAALPSLITAHRSDDAIYFGPAKALLAQAMRDPETQYRYDWNYPVARQIAGTLIKTGSRDVATALFRAGAEGGSKLSRMIDAQSAAEKAA